MTADACKALEHRNFADFIRIRSETLFSAALNLATGGPG
jgi:hypothetical protein